MIEFNKKTRKQLRDLMIKAYAKELNQLLLKLSKQFDAWKNNEIDCWKLEELIHRFHNYEAKKLYDAYHSGANPILIVTSALTRKLIQKEDIPDEALAYVENCMGLFEDNS